MTFYCYALCSLFRKVNRNMNYSESTPKSTRTVENGYLTRSPLISRSESSLVDDGLEERRLGEGRKQDQPSSGLTVLSASTGELVRSSPSLARPAVSPLHNQAQQSEDSSSSNNSLASVHSIHPQENNSPSEEEDALEEKEKAEEKNDETATNEEQVENGSKENIAGDVNGNPRSEAQQESQEMSVEDVDENENPNASEIGTPDTKSLGTPSSEFGSESSKTTQTSGNTIDSLTNGDEKPRRRGIPRRIGLRSRSSITPSSKDRPPLFPPTLPPFENPKDALTKTLLQLENPEWEVVMQGLQGLVRLARHHSKMLTVTPHPVVTALVRNIRNLRSQVSRGSCQASIEVFDSMGRFLDTEVEDLAGALLSRTADTNKFLRGDALSALQSMVDHTSPVRSIGILANKGSKHQNALVRCATSHLLLRLTKKLGAERCLSLPKESRDLLILTSAKLLTEGSLDTRKYAKEIFQQLNADPRLLTVMSEVVPNNILRNISKVLSKIAYH